MTLLFICVRLAERIHLVWSEEALCEKGIEAHIHPGCKSGGCRLGVLKTEDPVTRSQTGAQPAVAGPPT